MMIGIRLIVFLSPNEIKEIHIKAGVLRNDDDWNPIDCFLKSQRNKGNIQKGWRNEI